MPIPVIPRRPPAKPRRESFLLKSMLVASALFVGALVMANEEFYLSAPGHSLSEAGSHAAAGGAVRPAYSTFSPSWCTSTLHFFSSRSRSAA